MRSHYLFDLDIFLAMEVVVVKINKALESIIKEVNHMQNENGCELVKGLAGRSKGPRKPLSPELQALIDEMVDERLAKIQNTS